MSHRPNQSAWRDIQQPVFERALVRAVAQGWLDARQLSEYHWRVWNPARPKEIVDYWPRTGKWQVMYGKNPPAGQGWMPLFIRLTTKSAQDIRDLEARLNEANFQTGRGL